MLILGTDHFNEIIRGSKIGRALPERLAGHGEDLSVTIVMAEEQLRGWLTQIGRRRDLSGQTEAYRRLQESIGAFANWRLLPFNDVAPARLSQLRANGVRIGSMDLSIASIAIAYGATLLARTATDFGPRPGLSIEDWL